MSSAISLVVVERDQCVWLKGHFIHQRAYSYFTQSTLQSFSFSPSICCPYLSLTLSFHTSFVFLLRAQLSHRIKMFWLIFQALYRAISWKRGALSRERGGTTCLLYACGRERRRDFVVLVYASKSGGSSWHSHPPFQRILFFCCYVLLPSCFPSFLFSLVAALSSVKSNHFSL